MPKLFISLSKLNFVVKHLISVNCTVGTLICIKRWISVVRHPIPGNCIWILIKKVNFCCVWLRTHITTSFWPWGPNLNSGCRRLNLTQYKQYLPMTIKYLKTSSQKSHCVVICLKCPLASTNQLGGVSLWLNHLINYP